MIPFRLRLAARRACHAVRHALTALKIANVSAGCCSCGRYTHDWVYWGATAGGDPARPDWAQCQRCHDDPVHACMLQHPHAPAGSTHPTIVPTDR